MDDTISVMKIVGNCVMAWAAWVITYTGLPIEPATILAVLMVVDFAVGIGRARAIGEHVTSYKMKTGAISKCGVMLVPLVLALAAKGVGADLQWIVSWVVSLFILSETYSILANIYTDPHEAGGPRVGCYERRAEEKYAHCSNVWSEI